MKQKKPKPPQIRGVLKSHFSEIKHVQFEEVHGKFTFTFIKKGKGPFVVFPDDPMGRNVYPSVKIILASLMRQTQKRLLSVVKSI